MIVYVLIIVFTVWVLFSECKDLYCPNGGQESLGSLIKGCNDGNGCHIVRSRPIGTDTEEQLRDKIEYGLNLPSHCVYWRRSYIMALIIVILIAYVLLGELISERDLLICLIIVAALLYFSYSYYAYHHDKHIYNNIRDAVKRLN